MVFQFSCKVLVLIKLFSLLLLFHSFWDFHTSSNWYVFTGIRVVASLFRPPGPFSILADLKSAETWTVSFVLMISNSLRLFSRTFCIVQRQSLAICSPQPSCGSTYFLNGPPKILILEKGNFFSPKKTICPVGWGCRIHWGVHLYCYYSLVYSDREC